MPAAVYACFRRASSSEELRETLRRGACHAGCTNEPPRPETDERRDGDDKSDDRPELQPELEASCSRYKSLRGSRIEASEPVGERDDGGEAGPPWSCGLWGREGRPLAARGAIATTTLE